MWWERSPKRAVVDGEFIIECINPEHIVLICLLLRVQNSRRNTTVKMPN